MQVSILMVRVLVGALERAGVTRTQFLTTAGLDPKLLDDNGAWLSIGAYLRCIDAAHAISGDPAFGFRVGEHASLAMFDVIGPLTAHAATMRESIATMTRYSRLVAEGYDPELHETDSEAAIRFAALRGDLAAVRLTAEFSLTALLSVLQQFAGPDARPLRASFAYPAPTYADEYTRIFGDVARFDEAHTELAFPRAWLDTPQLYRSPDLHSLLKQQAERALDRLARDVTQTARVEALLAEHGPQPPTMDQAARQLGLSRRSLNRRLADEGVAYSDLVERSRIATAKRLLENPRASIQEIAYAMGFAAPAAFHRAFKRWTGMTPKQYQDSF